MRLGSWESQDSRGTFELLKHSALHRFHSSPLCPLWPPILLHPAQPSAHVCRILELGILHIFFFLFFCIRTSFLFIAE